MDDRIAANRETWEALADLHPETEFYDVEGFLAGEGTLDPVEPEELGPVEGRSLLHLQCHFGLDSLSWVRRGAEVTGVDFAATAVAAARELAAEAGLADRASFLESDVYGLPDRLDGEFEVVYTSFGVLTWLPDLDRWAEVIESFLAPGGRFYVAEFHPVAFTLDETTTAEEPRFTYPYFPRDEPIAIEAEGSYADADADVGAGTTYEWPHSLGEVVTALCDVGLDIEFLHEYPWSRFAAVDAMEEREHGRYHLPGTEEIPFVFTLRASAPGGGA
jgi:SAM-dependent methyltransferase